MGRRVSKFGGKILADRERMENAIDFMLMEKERSDMVVSAPGARHEGDPKVTDLLIEAAEEHDPECDAARQVKERIMEIGKGLGDIAELLCKTLDTKLEMTEDQYYRHEVMAFGEYASARLIAEMIKARSKPVLFLDPKNIGILAKKENGDYLPDEECFPAVRQKIDEMLRDMPPNTITVMGGFYIVTRNGHIVTISRQGSDVSGAVRAVIANASLYENVTNEDGLMAANPNIVENPRKITSITFTETGELSYRDFKLHADTISYLIEPAIPVHVMNADKPRENGTYIVSKRDVAPDEYVIGVAAGLRKIPFTIVKPLMNRQVGFMSQLAGLLKEKGISIEHVTTGIDSTTVYLDHRYVANPLDENDLVRAAREMFSPLDTSIDRIAILAAVGLGMRNHVDAESRVLSAITKQGIKPLMIDCGPPGISMFVGVDEKRADDAVRAAYNEFYPAK